MRMAVHFEHLGRTENPMTPNASEAPFEVTSVDREQPAYWGSVFAMSLCVFALVASEFMPVSLLTPIASDLGITEGIAGQGISISGAFAVLTSLSISALVGTMDRKKLLLVLTGACPEFCVNGADIKYRRGDLRTRW